MFNMSRALLYNIGSFTFLYVVKSQFYVLYFAGSFIEY